MRDIRIIGAKTAEQWFPGSSVEIERLKIVTIYHIPGGGLSKSHLVGQRQGGETLTWLDGSVDGIKLWCSIWNVAPWGVMQYGSKKWLSERMVMELA